MEMEGKLSRNKIKYIAILAMAVDHIGMNFIPISTFPGLLCRIIGRFCAPVMCFFLAEGYVHTRSKKSYGKRLLIFGLISQIPFALMNYGGPERDALTGAVLGSGGDFFWKCVKNALLTPQFNMILTLFLSFLILYVYDLVPGERLRITLIGLCLAASMLCDWGLVGPLYTLAFAINRGDRRKQVISFSVITAGFVLMQTSFCLLNHAHWYGEMWQLGLFLFLPVLFLYNNEPGSRKAFHKWFFYIFYPLHFMILWGLEWILAYA